MSTDQFALSNLVPSIPDERDYLYIPPGEGWPTQRSVDLKPFAGSRQNQIAGYCTASATRNACDSLNARGGVVDPLSEAFLYFNTRALENRIGQEGAQTRDALRSALHHGICDEETWPTRLGMINVEPNEAAKTEALTQRLMRYERIYHFSEGSPSQLATRNSKLIMWAQAEGLPVVFAIRVGQQFYGIKGPLAQQNYQPVSASNPHIGNHAMCAVGYTGQAPYGEVAENSWGETHGDNGYVFLPWSVFTQDLIEAWAIRGFAGAKIRPAPGILLRELTRNYLSVRVAVPAPGVTNIWVGARLNGEIWLKHQDGAWHPFDGSTFPPHLVNVPIEDERDIVIVDKTDLRAYAGAEVYVAHGADPMTWTIAKVVTIPKF